MTGWAPHPSQQQPAKRGSATVSFEDLARDFWEGGGGGGGGQGGAQSGSGGSSSSSRPPD